MTLGETIQAKRTGRGLSQEKLAELVGVSRQAVSKWELNAAVPDTDKLVPLARALGVTVDELLGNTADQDTPEVREALPADGRPGWFAVHWYWLGALPFLWGVQYIIRSYINVQSTLNMLPEGIQLGPLTAYAGADGALTFWSLLPLLLPLFVTPALGILAGLLIFFLGRRHVRKKYGGR